VQYASAFVGLRFGPCGCGDKLLSLATDAVLVVECELAFVLGGRLEIQNAPRKAVRHEVVQLVVVAEYAFAANAQQWERRAPFGRAYLAEPNLDRRIPVIVPFDRPIESEV